MITLHQAFEAWDDLYRDAGLPMDDEPMRAESWSEYTDQLCKEGEITASQYHYCPAPDDCDDLPDGDLIEEAQWLLDTAEVNAGADDLQDKYLADEDLVIPSDDMTLIESVTALVEAA